MTTVSKKPPTGMTSHQRSIAEKAVKLRYDQMQRALMAARNDSQDAVVTISESYYVRSYLSDNDPDKHPFKGTSLEKQAIKLRREITTFVKTAQKIRDAQETRMKKINAVVSNLEREMKDSRDEAVIRVNFNGQSDDMLAFLEGLPTIGVIENRLKQLGVTTGEQFKQLTVE